MLWKSIAQSLLLLRKSLRKWYWGKYTNLELNTSKGVFSDPAKLKSLTILQGGMQWSRSSWQMSYSIHWCSGSYIGVWGSVMHLDTSLHSVCSISVFTTTSFCVYVLAGHLAPLHLVMRVVFISPMWFSTHPFRVPPLLWFPRIRTTSTLFRTHPSLSMQQSTHFLPVHHLHSSTNLSVHPQHTFHLCFPCYSEFSSCPVILRVWEIFLCVGRTLLFELPPASNSRHQPVHCPLPVSEGTHPLAHPSRPLHPP